jgi:hypothetical protein
MVRMYYSLKCFVRVEFVSWNYFVSDVPLTDMCIYGGTHLLANHYSYSHVTSPFIQLQEGEHDVTSVVCCTHAHSLVAHILLLLLSLPYD